LFIHSRTASLGAVAALFIAFGVAQPASAAASVRVVDDDRAQCASADYSTISAAVTAATAGDTIKVCAGIYPESVQVDKSLTFNGAKAGVDGRSGRGQLSLESIVGSSQMGV